MNADLAAQARRTLAAPAQATLLVGGVGRLDAADPTVVLHDRDGQPTFLCEPGSAVIAAARERREALLMLDCRPAESPAASVMIAGRLTVAGVEDVDGTPVLVIALPPERVCIEFDDPRLSTVAQREVSLRRYLAADDGLLGAQLRRIQAHTNDAHQHELRSFAAHRSGTSIDAIAGARLARLDEHGADVHWVDADGAHAAAIRFPRPVSCPRALAEMLRGQLTES